MGSDRLGPPPNTPMSSSIPSMTVKSGPAPPLFPSPCAPTPPPILPIPVFPLEGKAGGGGTGRAGEEEDC